MFKKKQSVDSTLMVFEENKVRVLPCTVEGDVLSVENEIYPIADCKEYYRPEGGIIYTIGVDVFSVIQARKLKELQESVVLKSVFDFSQSTIPWYVWVNLGLLVTILALK